MSISGDKIPFVCGEGQCWTDKRPVLHRARPSRNYFHAQPQHLAERLEFLGVVAVDPLEMVAVDEASAEELVAPACGRLDHRFHRAPDQILSPTAGADQRAFEHQELGRSRVDTRTVTVFSLLFMKSMTAFVPQPC